MIPGPRYIYECPKCSTLLMRGSLRSGNTIGASLFSDGKQIAPMLPDFPNLTKCKKCDTIFWLSEMKEIGVCDAMKEEWKPEWENVNSAEFLGVTDLFRSLEMDTVKNDKEKEKNVRIQIWWTFNDRIRERKNIFVQKDDEVLWKQNCQRLIELIDTKDVNQKIMTAELYRNLGEFDLCMELINTLDNKFDWVIEQFKVECENKNKLLIQIY